MAEPTNTERAQNYLREFQQLQGIRWNWESYWEDIARRVLPHQNVFQRAVLGVSQAERRTEYIFDSTGPQALENCAALFESMLFPRMQKWHNLVPTDPALKDDRDARAYLENLNDILFAARYSPRANFASQAHENMLGLIAFGTGSVFVDDALGSTLRYRAVPLQDLYFAENHVGVIDTVFRKFDFTATQAVDKWGEDKVPPGVLANFQNPAQSHRVYEWLHVVKPRRAPVYGRADYLGMPWEECYLCVHPLQIVDEGGYRINPYATSRFTVGPREVYGRSPFFIALADVKMLNEMSRTDLNNAQRTADPPVLLPEAGNAFSVRPGALNYGMVSDDGKPLAIPYISGAKVDITEEKMEYRRKAIKEAAYGNVFEMLLQNPNMTATQVLQIAEERGVLLTPAMGRQQSEFLGNVINREIDILAHAGVLDSLGPMPESLARSGGFIKVEYQSQLNRLQRAQDLIAIQRSLEQLIPIAEAGHPEVLSIYNWEKLGREVNDINGVRADILLSPEELAALKEQQAQQQNLMALAQAAPQAAGAAKNLAQAQQIATASPPQQGAQQG